MRKMMMMMRQKKLKVTTEAGTFVLRHEEGAEELARSPDMRPYLELMKAILQGRENLESYLEAISALPLEKRYLWRVVSAMKWAFADFESQNVFVDKETLSRDDLMKVADLMEPRTIQFVLFMKALVDPESMERMILHAIAHSKKKGTPGTVSVSSE